jgi:transposase-like protein
MRDINLSQENLAVQWQYVKRNLKELGIAANLDGFEQKAHRAIEKLMQDDIYEEFKLQIAADRYEHAPMRQDERKGKYQRFFTTTFGTSKIMIPRTRDGLKIQYSLFDRYQRRQKKFDNTVVLSMILGLSMRKQRKFFRAFIGDAVSHGTASKLLRNLEADLKEYRTQKIEDKYKYILIDGLWVSVKSGNYLRKGVILFVMGITLDNKKDMIAFKLAKGETEEEVTGLLNDIYRRGLEGKHLKLVASDGSKGIKAAIKMVYPYAKWQLCHTHKLRNLSVNIRHKIKNRRKVMSQARAIYKSKTKRQAIKRFNRFCDKWQNIEPKAVRCFRQDFYDSIVYYEFMDDKNFISTTNHLERYLEEVRRRIKIQGYFKNERSLNLWIFGIISQFRREERGDEPKFIFTLKKEPHYEIASGTSYPRNDKTESAQLS